MSGRRTRDFFLIGLILIGMFCVNGCSSKAETAPVFQSNHGIPVLMYHSVSDKKGSKLFMPVEKFRQQMKYLRDNGFTALTPEEALAYFTGVEPIPEKPVLVTFDDGYADNYTNAFPILKQYGIRATIFVITAATDTDPGKLTGEQIKEMAANGVSIQSHTVNHDDLSALPFSKQLSILTASRKQIEDLTGRKVFCLAYPFGKYNQSTLKAADEAGYQMAFTIHPGFAYKSEGILTLSRIRIDGTDKMQMFRFDLNFKNQINHEK